MLDDKTAKALRDLREVWRKANNAGALEALRCDTSLIEVSQRIAEGLKEEHTPGPWKAYPFPTPSHRNPPKWRVEGPLPDGIWTFSQADARLIAAAPQMLAALRDVDSAGAFECCCGETPCCGSCTATMVKDAIAAATGEEPLPSTGQINQAFREVVVDEGTMEECSAHARELASQPAPVETLPSLLDRARWLLHDLRMTRPPGKQLGQQMSDGATECLWLRVDQLLAEFELEERS
jgi:hypothetical protein